MTLVIEGSLQVKKAAVKPKEEIISTFGFLIFY